MEEQEKKKRIELEQDMSWKMYQILTITACTANLIGTICNFCIHGTKLPTILCGICLLMIMTIGIIGWTTKKVQIPAVLIILLLVWFEFLICIIATVMPLSYIWSWGSLDWRYFSREMW